MSNKPVIIPDLEARVPTRGLPRGLVSEVSFWLSLALLLWYLVMHLYPSAGSLRVFERLLPVWFVVALGAAAFGFAGVVRHQGRSWKAVFALCIGCMALGLGLIILNGMSQQARFEERTRQECATNMRGIGKLLVAYAEGHSGEFPASLGAFYKEHPKMKYLLPRCPRRWDDLEHPLRKEEEFLRSFDDPTHPNNSYIYLGKGLTTHSGDAVLMYEMPKNHGVGFNVLYADGRVVWYPSSDASRIIGPLRSRVYETAP